LIARAESLLSTRERDYEGALAELSEVNAGLQHDREALARDRAHLESLQNNLRARTEALERERRQFADAAETRMQQALREFAAELERRAALRGAQGERARVTPGQSALLSRTVDEMHRDLGIRPERSDARVTGRFEIDEPVRVLSFDQDATVIADNGQSVLVAIGAMRTVVPKSDLARRGAAVPGAKRRRAEAQAGMAKLEAATRTMAELDVRGKRFVDAEPIVERWIDEAVLAGSSPLRLIHGKGTGMLGRGLQEHLRAHPSVASLRYGDENEGGGGVTILELR
jgi:DNA mismatch repair protein MutS2